MAKSKTLDQQLADIVLQTEFSSPEGRHYSIEGRNIYIGKNDVDFFEKLQSLPTAIKIPLLCIEIEEMEAILLAEKKKQKAVIATIFKGEWLDQECGYPMDFTDPLLNEDAFGIKLSAKEIIKKSNASKLSMKELEQIISFFASHKVYQNF